MINSKQDKDKRGHILVKFPRAYATELELAQDSRRLLTQLALR